MIKGRGTDSGTPLLVIGLSAENCFRLQEGKPIKFDAAEVGLSDLHVLVVGGATEQTIVDELRAQGLLPDQGGGQPA